MAKSPLPMNDIFGLNLGPWVKHLLPVLLALVLSMLCLYPFLWMLLASFKTDPEIFKSALHFPEKWQWSHYSSLFQGTWIPYLQEYWNTLFIATLQTILGTSLACMAGYVLGLGPFRGRIFLLGAGIAVVLLPRQILILPLFTWMNVLGLIDSPWSVIWPGAVSGIGLLYFLQIFRRLPKNLLDTARCEGAHEGQVFLTAIRLSMPQIAAFGLIHFILAWHEHLIPLVMLQSEHTMTISIALSNLAAGSPRIPFGLLMAAASLTLIPTLFLFVLLRSRLQSALGQLTEI